jgi:adenylate kinase
VILVVLLGAPGVGKGTQAKLLAEKYNLSILSTGEILRNALREATELGLKVKEMMNSGALVPDEIVCDLVENELKKKTNYKGYILDGFPRTIYQANKLNDMVATNDQLEDFYVVSLSLSEEEIIKRLSARIACKNCNQSYNSITNPTKIKGQCDICGHTEFYVREDDKEEAVKVRLDTYLNQTSPLIKYYQTYKHYVDVDAKRDINSIHNEIVRFIANA